MITDFFAIRRVMSQLAKHRTDLQNGKEDDKVPEGAL